MAKLMVMVAVVAVGCGAAGAVVAVGAAVGCVAVGGAGTLVGVGGTSVAVGVAPQAATRRTRPPITASVSGRKRR